MFINKAVVGSGRGDPPKYVVEGVASCRPPSDPGGPRPRPCGHFSQFRVDALQTCRIRSASYWVWMLHCLGAP